MKRCGLAALLVVAACAGNAAPNSDPESASVATARKTDVITAEELADPSVNAGDALEAVRRLRPGFLMSRGATSMKNPAAGSVHVSIDGAPLMTLDNLSHVRPNQIAEIRYLSAPDAAQRFGTAAGSGGVILVKLK